MNTFTSSGWPSYPIGPNNRRWASDRATDDGTFRNSHRGHDGQTVGNLGELLAHWWLTQHSIQPRWDRATTHDCTLPDGTTVDVKTKDRTVPPRPHYDCTVPLYNHGHQTPDLFLFVTLLQQDGVHIRGWIVGSSTYRNITRHGRRWEAGQTDPANGTTFWTDCLNLQIGDLTTPADTADTVKANMAVWSPTREGATHGR